MSGGIDMKNEAGVSSVVGVVLLLLLVVVVSSILALTLSSATNEAVDSTPNVIFTLSKDPQMLYHSGGDILYKNRLVFYDNGVDITSGVRINSEDTWTEWRTGQAIKLPGGYYVANLTIIALDSLGREQLLYRGSGAVSTPLPTPEPTPNPYYTVGSDHADGFATVAEFVESLNIWSNALYGADVAKCSGNAIAFKRDVPIGGEPIRITAGMGTVSLTNLGDGTLSEVKFTRAPGYEGELLVISSGAGLQTPGANLILDGMGQVAASPLLVINSGGSLVVNGYRITLINNINPTGNGGALHNEGSVSVTVYLNVSGNTAMNGAGIYNLGVMTLNSPSVITDNAASENGGGIYNEGQLTSGSLVNVSGNTAMNGAGIYNLGGLTLSSPNEIKDNVALEKGGGIFNGGPGPVSIKGPITQNSAKYGGGVYNEGSISPFEGTISGNTASISGGGVYNKGTYKFSGVSTVTNNNAQSGSGGGIYNEGSIPSFEGTISGNTASISGGGVYNKGTSTFKWTSTITSNKAQYGGGVYNTGTVPTFGGSISGNTATIQGGGLYNTNSFTLGGSSIAGNTAPLNPDRYG